MSLRIIKAGILDTVQDAGRYGYQHLGINPSGAMDKYSAQLANALLGKDLNAPVIELHFPASIIQFEKDTIICITGADFTTTIDGTEIPIDHPIAVAKNTTLEFKKLAKGARCYLSVVNDFAMDKWLNSSSTNLLAELGGQNGKALKKNDVIHFKNPFNVAHLLHNKSFAVLHWRPDHDLEMKFEIEVVIGAEWYRLMQKSYEIFTTEKFGVTPAADRMGYRLYGKDLFVNDESQLISSAVSFGTIQLLPNGQLIVLMADHQTTGGYPKIAHVISADLPLLAQKQPMERITFKITDLQSAEEKLVAQQKYLQHLQSACKLKMENIL
jgi:antagonist of KipI